MATDQLQLHASAIAFGNVGCLITGGAGSGKSTLALELIALGAMLISDDRTDINLSEGKLIASCPRPIAGLIEARGAGIIRVTPAKPSSLALWVDLDSSPAERLPRPQNRDLLGTPVPVIFGPYRPGLAAIAKVLLTGGSLTDPDEPVAP